MEIYLMYAIGGLIIGVAIIPFIAFGTIVYADWVSERNRKKRMKEIIEIEKRRNS